MISVVAIVILLFNIVNGLIDGIPEEDYAWRDYQGTIPLDAFVGGQNKAGVKLYIGQALYEGKFIPGKILPNDDNVYIEFFQKELRLNNNVKILCTSQPHKFQWFRTRSSELRLAKKLLLKGGYEPNVSTYLGRTSTYGIANVGKVICQTASECYGLYTSDNGSTTLNTEFEVLTYNPNLPSKLSNSNVNTSTCKNKHCSRRTINMYNRV